MTAEVAIMNKEAIALAADSAVTLREKVFASANKIFALSKYHPVGIMVYRSADFMFVPWETIIKVYRNKLKDKKFDKLEEYAMDFINFLEKERTLFPKEVQERYLKDNIYVHLFRIKKIIEDRIDEKCRKGNKITDKGLRKIVVEVIEEDYHRWRKATILPSVPKGHIKKLIDKYRTIFNKSIRDVFEKLPITKTLSRKLMEIGASLFAKDMMLFLTSGVVIAGFGEKDVFPCLRVFLIEGVLDNVLKYKRIRSKDVDISSTVDDAAIVPFAQSEMVYVFMQGVDSSYEGFVEKNVSELLNRYADIFIEKFEKKLTKKGKDIFKVKFGSVVPELKSSCAKDLYSPFIEKLKRYRRNIFISPVTAVVARLPKDELASMAESLVNLTVVKRRVTKGTETVSGPIDVAVISKGDGLIWIKRKHYFKPELNPQFFSNYYRQGDRK